MNELKEMLPYLLVCAVAFYILPLLGKDTGSFMLILLVVTPLACFVASLFYGIKNGFNLVLPGIVGSIFIPSIFIYYNSSAWVYVIGYAVISLTGNLVGRLIKGS